MKQLRSIVAVLCLITFGCGSTAIISTRNGTFDAKIKRSDQENIIIETMNGEKPVKRNEIIDIDHPGNGVGTTGLILSGLEIGAAAALSVTPLGLIIWVPMTIWGYYTWNKSVSAAKSNP